MSRNRQRALLALACLAPLTAAAPSEPQAADQPCEDADVVPSGDNTARAGASVLCLVNGERTDRGEQPLAPAGELRQAGQGMSDLMVEQSFFAHTTPSGRTLSDRVRPTGYLPGTDNWLLGENLAWGSGSLATPRAIVDGWMNSPEHRDNILDRGYEDAGVGVTMGAPSRDRQGGTTFTLDFGTRDTRPAVSVPARVGGAATRAAADGITYRAECSKPCTLRARLIGRRAGDQHPRLLASGLRRLPRGGIARVTVDLRPSVAAAPRRLEGADLKLVTEASGTPVAHTTRVRLR